MPVESCWHWCESCKSDWRHDVPAGTTLELDKYFQACPTCAAKRPRRPKVVIAPLVFDAPVETTEDEVIAADAGMLTPLLDDVANDTIPFEALMTELSGEESL